MELRQTSEATQIVIVDDHTLTRRSLKNMLSDEPDIEVIGEAASGEEALLLCARLKPDLVLMDVRMPEMDGLAATREIKQRHPKISVMMLTMYENPDYLFEALKVGAAGYVLKDASREVVVEAVRRAVDGESPLDVALAARLLKRLATEKSGRKAEADRSRSRVVPLSPREREVLELMRLGLTNPQIGRELSVSTRTAKNHVEHIMAKLGASDRTQAVVRALELEILEL
jgi:two-component system, NarL family, response regulator DegU